MLIEPVAEVTLRRLRRRPVSRIGRTRVALAHVRRTGVSIARTSSALRWRTLVWRTLIRRTWMRRPLIRPIRIRIARTRAATAARIRCGHRVAIALRPLRRRLLPVVPGLHRGPGLVLRRSLPVRRSGVRGRSLPIRRRGPIGRSRVMLRWCRMGRGRVGVLAKRHQRRRTEDDRSRRAFHPARFVPPGQHPSTPSSCVGQIASSCCYHCRRRRCLRAPPTGPAVGRCYPWFAGRAPLRSPQAPPAAVPS